MAIFKGLIEKAKDRYDLERPSPPPPIPNGIQRPIDPPTEAQARASIEAEMAQARQQAAQYGMPQRYVDKIFSRDQYTPPPSPPSLPPVMTDTVPERFMPPPPDPRIPPTIISDPRLRPEVIAPPRRDGGTPMPDPRSAVIFIIQRPQQQERLILTHSLWATLCPYSYLKVP